MEINKHILKIAIIGLILITSPLWIHILAWIMMMMLTIFMMFILFAFPILAIIAIVGIAYTAYIFLTDKLS